MIIQKVVALETKTVSNLPAPQTGGQDNKKEDRSPNLVFSQLLQMMFGISL
jgi:hypothetical protein